MESPGRVRVPDGPAVLILIVPARLRRTAARDRVRPLPDRGTSLPPALCERCHRSLARRSVAVCRVAVFVVPDVQCPHPGPCYGHARLEDTADNFAMCKHVEIVVARCVTKGRRAFQSEVILFHRDTPGQ